MKPKTLLYVAAIAAACASVPAPTAAEAVRLDAARARLATDPEGALQIVDQVLRDHPDLREARLLAGEGSLALFRRGSGGNAELLLQDAVRHFELGLEDRPRGDAPAACRQLADCLFELGEWERCSAFAVRATEGFRAIGTGAANRDAEAALLLAAQADYRLFAAARQAELDAAPPDLRERPPVGGDTARLAETAALRFEAVHGTFPAEAATRLAQIRLWLGQSAEALRELERGLRAAPDATEVHDAYLTWYRDNDQFDALVGAYARFVREQPGVPILRWHQGRALAARADRQRGVGNFAAAADGYARARDAFGQYLAMVPAHADAANQWRAGCALSEAAMALELGLLDAARDQLFAAADFGAADGDEARVRTYAGLAFALHQRFAESGPDALPRTLAFAERLLARHPDRWGFAYNNAALVARDLGVQRANAGDDAAARDLWERSYAWYERAVALEPNDPRIVNDCGLMLVYHLHRDPARARELFDRATALGEAQLAALPADAEPQQREQVEEALGDALQNIAVLLRDQGAGFDAARPFLERAVRYYPYERREAAALLRTAGQPAGAADAAAQGGAAEAMAKVRAGVDAKATAGDFDGALALLDTIAKECKDHAPFQLRRGELNLALARQTRDQGRRGVDFFYQDALGALKRAVELDSEPAAPRQLLAEATYESGDTAGAAAVASALLLHLQSQGGGTREQLLAAHTVRANAAARAYMTAKAAGDDATDLLTQARASLRQLEQEQMLTPDLLSTWSNTEQWAGAPAEAVNVWLRALQRTPDDQAMLGQAVDTAAAQKQLPLVVDALAQRTDATAGWYLGKARYLLAGAERTAGQAERAQQLLDEARSAFAQSMQQNPAYRDSCEQWLAMCLGKKGAIAYHADDDAKAETWLLESARLRPDRIAEDLGDGESTKRSLLFLVDRFLKRNDLAKVEAISRAAAEAAAGDVDLQNNAGLFARDYGNQLERDGKRKQADEMYEQSYKAYRKAQQLDPANVRLRNDCALIAIWHLDRDWEQSRQLLDSAIADGEKQLRDAPPDDPNERQQLEEAVGDCYENLALWHLKHGKDGKAAKDAATASLKYFPGERRPGAQRHLQAADRLLRGK
ncbi:MAG: hypothetical protein JNL08_15585 [Planctomycetes bacterium]|nr:hypothetical protein [Planctomycetota bacterium]